MATPVRKGHWKCAPVVSPETKNNLGTDATLPVPYPCFRTALSVPGRRPLDRVSVLQVVTLLPPLLRPVGLRADLCSARSSAGMFVGVALDLCVILGTTGVVLVSFS